jgi:GNAT superfamily N-acetyltransferase
MFIIRQAVPADGGTLVEFQLRMAEETEGIALDRAVVTEGVEAVFCDPARGQYVVAAAGGRVVGSLLLTTEWSDWRNGTFLWIQSVYVLPAFRRQGVFSALYRHARQRVEASPALRGLKLYVVKNNARARQAYQALGMTGGHFEVFEWIKQA